MTISAGILGDRSLFPQLRYRSYLNHAAISPPSTAVENAVQNVLTDVKTNGVGSFPRWIDQRDRLRGKIAGLIDSDPQEIGFVANTTTGVLQAAWSIDWNNGDRIILFDGEFPTNITPWQRVAQEYGLQISWINARQAHQDMAKLLQETDNALRKGARLLAVSAVQFQTGLALPLQEIGRLCTKHGALLFVDGIQAVGSVPLSVRDCNIDMMSCGSHKWLMGLEGCGFLFINQRLIQQLKPRMTGWISHQEGFRFLFEGKGHLRYDRGFQQNASYVEGGAYNSIGFAALEKSIDQLMHFGIPAIHNHINLFLDALEEGMTDMGYRSLRHRSHRSGILSLQPPDHLDGKAIVDQLELDGISCSFPDGNIRISPHWPNNTDEVEMIIDALQSVHR